MKEQKSVKIKKLSSLSIIMVLTLRTLISNAQINNLKLPNHIDFNLPTKTIIDKLSKDKSVKLSRVDTSTVVFPIVTYTTAFTDSVCLKFHREHFSSMAIHFKDSCFFYYVKSFCFDNLRISKGSKGLKKQTFNGKEYDITISETKGLENSKYSIWIRSKKYPIHI